jgi:hypothetical protein
MGRPANIFKLNTSIATLSVQGGDQSATYLEGTQLEPQCFSCHINNKNNPAYVVMYGLCTSMYNIWPLAIGSKLVMHVLTFYKSCGDYMKWLTKGQFLKEQQLGPYFDHYCLQRLHLAERHVSWRIASNYTN